MESIKSSKKVGVLWVLGCFALWVLLIILKAAGVISMGWIAVLSGIVWLPWLLAVTAVLVVTILYAAAKLKRWYRRHKMDARIIQQAKAAGVWNTNAGGRALELYAKECGVKKFAGESDAHLRYRIKEAAENGGPSHGI